MAANGVILGDDYVNSLKGAQSKSSNASTVYSLLGGKSDANKSQNTNKMSDLNKYLASQGYSILNWTKMVQLAQSLGLSDIDGTNKVGSDKLGEINKNRILQELKRLLSNSTFDTGGIAKSLGEDGFGLIKKDELILNQSGSKIYTQQLAPLMSDFVKNFNLIKPDLTNITNRSSSPSISITIPISGNATPSTVSALNSASNNIVKQIMSEVRKL